MRAVADLIRRAFELGAFQHGPYCEIGDTIRPWFVGIENKVPLQDGFRTPLWVPVVWYAVVDRVAPELYHQRLKLPRQDGDMNVLPTEAEVEAVADAINKEADRIDAEVVAGQMKATTVEGQGGKKYPWGDDDPETPLSTAKLADRLGVLSEDRKKREAVRKRLESWRKANFDGGWIEPKDPRPREPKYLYPLGKVWSLIEDLKSG